MSSTGNDLGDHALVAVAAGHLVAGCRRRLTARYTLTIFSTPAGQLVALGQLLALFFEGQVEAVRGVWSSEFLIDSDLVATVVVGRADVEPVVLSDRGQVIVCRWPCTFGDAVRAAVGDLAR